MTREYGDYIADIIDAMNKAIEFVSNMDYNEFVQDIKTTYAVIRAIEIIGEAVKNIPKEVKANYPEIPWKDIAGMRDILVHEYFGAKLDKVWRVELGTSI